MNHSLASLFPALGKKNRQVSGDQVALLELFPAPALLVHRDSHLILQVNSQVLELTSFTRAEMVERRLDSLGLDPLDFGLEGVQTAYLLAHSGARLPVRAQIRPLSDASPVLLVSLEPHRPAAMETDSKTRPSPWSPIRTLVGAASQANLDAALKQALQAGQVLTGAPVLALYQVGEEDPGLKLTTGCGPFQELPPLLLLPDFIALQTPMVWQAGDRSASALHRWARMHNLAYLAWAPVGQPPAAIGLLVAASPLGMLSPELLPALQALAASINTILEVHARSSSWQAALQQHAQDLAIAQAYEEVIQEGLLVLSPELSLVRMNLAAEVALGYTGPEVEGQPVDKFLIGSESFLPALTAAQRGSATFSLDEIHLYRRDGEFFPAQVRVLPVFEKDRVVWIVVLLRDLSEQEKIQVRTEQLEQHALLGEVTAIFAHEVRNPINNISTGLQVLGMNLSEGDPNQEMIARLLQDCDRLTELMKSVLSFARPADLVFEPVNLEVLLQRLLERQRARMLRAGIEYKFQVDPGLPLIQANGKALEQVFTNLIANAVQAMSESGGNLMVRIRLPEAPVTPLPSPASGDGAGDEAVADEAVADRREYVVISVADTGPGIPKELQERIFMPFFTTHKNGTGLGLSITKRIVTAHKGAIWVNSFPGGTIFSVRLPVHTL